MGKHGACDEYKKDDNKNVNDRHEIWGMPQEIDQPPGTKYNNGQNQRCDKKPLVFADGIQARKQNYRKEDVQKQRPAN